MLIANIVAQIEAKEKEIHENYLEIQKVDNLIKGLKVKQRALLDVDTNLTYELKELREKLQEELK